MGADKEIKIEQNLPNLNPDYSGFCMFDRNTLCSVVLRPKKPLLHFNQYVWLFPHNVFPFPFGACAAVAAFYGPCVRWWAVHFPAACKNEAKWMFGHLDINSDGLLSVSEMYDLEHDQNERCIKPFIDTCDMDKDNNLSPREWCRCFEKTDRPCAAVRRRLGTDLYGIMRIYLPSLIFFLFALNRRYCIQSFSCNCRWICARLWRTRLLQANAMSQFSRCVLVRWQARHRIRQHTHKGQAKLR